MKNSYRLVWFQNFHKAAGSSVVATALANQETAFPAHQNGNPCDKQGELIPLDTYSSQELTSFVDRCENEGITFVACEWDIVDYDTLKSDPRVVLITCIRDPLKRFVSEFYYSFYRGLHDHENFELHLANQLKTSQNEYYCRILSRKQRVEALEEADLARSKKILSNFDFISVLEKENSLNALYTALGWHLEKARHINKTGFNRKRAFRFFFKGKRHLTKRHRTHPQVAPDKVFSDRFEEHNSLDRQLYQWAWQTSQL